MAVITLDLFGIDKWLWYDTNYIFVNDAHITDINVALKAGVLSEDDVEDVITVWDYTVEIVNGFVNNRYFDVSADIDELCSVIYLYVPNDDFSFFYEEFDYLPDSAVDGDYPCYPCHSYGDDFPAWYCDGDE